MENPEFWQQPIEWQKPEHVSFTQWLNSAGCHISVFPLEKRQADNIRPYRAPGNHPGAGCYSRSSCKNTTIIKKAREIFSNVTRNAFARPGYSRVYSRRLMTEAKEPITETSPAVSRP